MKYYLVVTYEKYNNRWELCNSYIHVNNTQEIIDLFFHNDNILILNIIEIKEV